MVDIDEMSTIFINRHLQAMATEKRKIDTVKMDMTRGPLLRKIIIFALPLIASGILQQSFNSVDVAVVGRFCGSEALAAVGSNGMVISILINLFVGISVGANVVISNYVGQKNSEGIRKAIATVGALALISGIAIMVIGLTITRPILELMNTPDDVIDLAATYLRVFFLGMPFMMIYNFGSAILRSMGDTKRPFYSLVVAGIVNVGLNLLFVIVFDMGVAGVALGTVISNAVNAAIIVYFLSHENYPFKLDPRHLRIETKEMSKMLRIGLPAGLQGMVFNFANIFIQTAINGYGSAAVAGSAAALNFEYYCYFIIVAFCQAAIAFTGQNYGAGLADRCNRVFKICLAMSLLWCGLFNIVIAWQDTFFARIFSDSPEVLRYASMRLHYVLMFQFIASSYEISGSCMRGLGYSMTPTILTIFGTCLIRLVWIYTYCPAHPGLDNLLVIYPISWVITGSMVLFAYFKVRRKAYAKLAGPATAI